MQQLCSAPAHSGRAGAALLAGEEEWVVSPSGPPLLFPLSWSRKAQPIALSQPPGRIGGGRRRHSRTQEYFYSYCSFAANVIGCVGFALYILSLLAITINKMEKTHQRPPSVSVKNEELPHTLGETQIGVKCRAA